MGRARARARDEAYVRDVLGTMSAANNILVLNDEAHHACPKMIQSGLDASEGLAIRTTILAYAIAIVGFAMIVAGTWDVYLLYNEQTFEVTLSDYATSIRTIAGGLAMIGLAQALRLLLEINARQSPRPAMLAS